MSFIFSRALVEASLQVNCSAVDAYAPLNLIPTPRPSLSLGKTTVPFLRSRFGMTFEPLTEDLGAELLMSWLADFPAKTSVQPAPETALTESEADSGQKWQGSFAKFDRAESKWRTPQCSLLGDSDEFSETWPRWGSMRNGVSYLRPIPALPICASESGLWPTPTRDSATERSSKYAQGGTPLTLAVKLWPTPTRRDYRSDKCTPEVKAERDAHSRGKTLPWVVGGLLNPEWVEWLMGWPIGHTALKPLETAKYQEWLQQHGRFFRSTEQCLTP